MVWSLSDRLGTVDTLTDASGVVVDKRTFDSFGRVLSETNPSVSFRYGYTGRERDLESGLEYYRARYYDPANGVFISVDPMGFGAGDTNLYRYVGNSSTLATDPSGMSSWLEDAWNSGVRNVQQGLNNAGRAIQQFGNNVGQGIADGATSFRNTVTSNAQAGLEYWASVAVAGQNEGNIWKQIAGTAGGLFSSLATEDNIDKVNETLAFAFGGEVVAGLKWVKSLAATPWVKAATPWLKSAFAANGVAQGGGQIGQAWSGVDENGRQLSAVERVTVAVTGVATIAASILSFKTTPTTNCFVAGTEIQTLDGTKNIEDIHVGDWVLSDDPATPGDIEYKQVLNTVVKQATGLVDVYIGGEKITTTEEHPFWVPDVGWVLAKDLHAGSHLQTKYESRLDVDKVVKHGDTATVYNFEVQGFHTYFVSDLGLLVHNNNCIPEGYTSAKPSHSPDPKKWIKKGGTIDENWTYTDWEGNTVSYVDGFPDYKSSGHVRAEVKIQQKGNHTTDYSDATTANGGVQPAGTTWHHYQDKTTMQAVDTEIHRRFTHRGGVSIKKKGT